VDVAVTIAFLHDALMTLRRQIGETTRNAGRSLATLRLEPAGIINPAPDRHFTTKNHRIS